MNYAIIGTGNMAWFIGRSCTAAGFHCTGVYGRNEAHAHMLADTVGADVFTDLSKLPAQSDMVVIAVSDVAIPSVVSSLHLQEHTVLVHTAGTVPSDVLAGAAPDYGVLWPVYSILKHALPAHRKIPCAWEGSSDKAAGRILQMIHCFSDDPFHTTETQRQWLHLAAVIDNNFINHLMAVSAQICAAQQLPFSVLKPILEQTFMNAGKQDPVALQTGPARRGDQATIRRHLDMLADNPEWQHLYAGLSASIGKMYQSMQEGKKGDD